MRRPGLHSAQPFNSCLAQAVTTCITGAAAAAERVTRRTALASYFACKPARFARLALSGCSQPHPADELKDKAKLTAVLTYHVVPGKVMAKDVKAGKVKTVQGSELTVSTTGGVMVDKAKVTKTDIVADNGVIHVIDTVIMPK